MSSSLTRHQNVVASSSSGLRPSTKPVRAYFFNARSFGSDQLICTHYCARKKGLLRISYIGNGNPGLSCRPPDLKKQWSISRRLRRIDRLLPSASADDGVVNGSSQTGSKNNIDDIRYKLSQSLQDDDYNTDLVQLLHDVARTFELAIKEQTSLSKISWFSTAWLGMDKDAWAKPLSYQASVYSLLLAVIEISSRGDERDRDINILVQRSLSRQCAPLEGVIRDKLSSKVPGAYDWFSSEKISAAVTSFINYFEEQHFTPATTMYRRGSSYVSGNSNDKSLLMLALNCIAAITKLGPTKVSCAQFFCTIPDLTGRLMDMLIDYAPVHQTYHLMKEIGLRKEFLVHFGPRAAGCRMENDLGAEEIMFWVGLVQKQLQRAIHREKIWSRLTCSESIEVLERDLAIFGFFIALGRSTQAFLSANSFEKLDEPVEGFIRYLIGGSVLYYPQLSTISSYQLYVEVVCEELDWLTFYPGAKSKGTLGQKQKEGPPSPDSIALVFDVCFHWIESFIKYSKWLENPSNVKAAKFLSKGHFKLKSCMEELGIKKDNLAVDKESQSFDKALEGVEEALLRLEELLEELHVSSSGSGKEHLKAACSDLERIRKLKKEAEFLEASFRAKEDSIHQDDGVGFTTPVGEQRDYARGTAGESSGVDKGGSNSSDGFWSSIVRSLTKSSDLSSSAAKDSKDFLFQEDTTSKAISESDPFEVRRFEILRSELMELEKRVQKTANLREYKEEEIQVKDDASTHENDAKGTLLAPAAKKDSIIAKSLDKLKETSTDVMQGTQLLAIDTGAALGLLRRVLIGDALTEKEKQALRRTLTDLASVVPIGILMLLPVTAVGHAAMLAAIQRYMPSLIPSTYGRERLDLLRKLEKVKEVEDEVNITEIANENV